MEETLTVSTGIIEALKNADFKYVEYSAMEKLQSWYSKKCVQRRTRKIEKDKIEHTYYKLEKGIIYEI